MSESNLEFKPVPKDARPVGGALLVVNEIRGDIDLLNEILFATEDLNLVGVVAAGDHCLGGQDPFAVYRRLNHISAKMVRGETDDALGVRLEHKPDDLRDVSGYESFLRTQERLGQVVCRRLSELPTTQVVHLGGHAGVMVVSGTPKLPHRGINEEMSDAELESLCGCAAEDVLIVGKGEGPFVRRINNTIVAHPGRLSRGEALLVQEFVGGAVGICILELSAWRKTQRWAG